MRWFLLLLLVGGCTSPSAYYLVPAPAMEEILSSNSELARRLVFILNAIPLEKKNESAPERKELDDPPKETKGRAGDLYASGDTDRPETQGQAPALDNLARGTSRHPGRPMRRGGGGRVPVP